EKQVEKMKKMECGNIASEVSKLHAYAWKTAKNPCICVTYITKAMFRIQEPTHRRGYQSATHAYA
ncbi:hypothetical protein PIB30_112170, partial [Stylosanthes scabra]|nr:hypothetical protein [Stylosanthes scabra]